MLPFLAGLAPFAPLIGGAIGAIGQLFAPKPKPTTQTTTGSIDLMGLRRDAEAAGFNPLGIIRAGGLAGYSSTTSVGSAGPDMRVSNALMTFGSGVSNWQYDPYGEQKSLAELALAKAQIASYGRNGGAPSGLSFGVPRSSGSSRTGVTDLTFFGQDWFANPGFDDAQKASDRYGDIAEEVVGLMNFVADSYHNSGFKGGKLAADVMSGASSFIRYLDERGAALRGKGIRPLPTGYVTGGGF